MLFLLDLNVTARIVREAGDLGRRTCGRDRAGPGRADLALLASAAASVTVIERDRRFQPALEELAAVAGDRLRVVEADALKTDILALVPAPRAGDRQPALQRGDAAADRLAAPDRPVRSPTLMFQKRWRTGWSPSREPCLWPTVGDRLGRCAEVDPLLTLPASAFTPPPKVDSTVVRFRPVPIATRSPSRRWRPSPPPPSASAATMLRASLRSLGDAEALLAESGLPPTARAEEIDIASFVRLARAVARRS